MSDEKKPATEEPGKELDAEQLENVSGGLGPAPGATAFKFWAQPDLGEEPPTETVSFVFHKID